MASPAASAAELPPEEPPGTRVTSHGLPVGPNAEFSVEEPIANSSQFNRPQSTAPACFNFVVTVASYGETKFASILLEAVSGWPVTAITSFNAIGIPSSGPPECPAARRASEAAACPRASASS